MKTIPFIAGILLLINGILHIVEYLNSNNMGILLFGIIYIMVGVLLFTRKTFAVYLGLIVPITGMSLSIIKFGIPELFSLSALFKLIGLIVVVLCAYVLFNRNKMTDLNPT
jgi:uncharacterized membrane protein HdeD (DUF308 family)